MDLSVVGWLAEDDTDGIDEEEEIVWNSGTMITVVMATTKESEKQMPSRRTA